VSRLVGGVLSSTSRLSWGNVRNRLLTRRNTYSAVFTVSRCFASSRALFAPSVGCREMMVPVGVTVTFVGGPRDGQVGKQVSGEPVAVLVVDESGGVYRWRDGAYWWEAAGSDPREAQ